MSTQIIQTQFKRIETKYIIDKAILPQLEEELKAHLKADEFAESTITNVYFDNKDFDMIRDSIAKKNSREKVRMRLYDAKPNAKSEAFLEVKKKEDGVGFKYRLTTNPISAERFVTKGIADQALVDGLDHSIVDDKVNAELTQLRKRYGSIKPMMYIYYDRKSYKGIADKKVRVTIDQNLLYRDENVSATAGKYGQDLLDPTKAIMEIKVPGEQPDWLANILAKYNIIQQSFSKYGTAYGLSKNLSKEEVYLARNLI